MSDELLTTRAVALQLGVSPSRVRQLVQQGRLTAEKLGRDLLIARSALDAFALKDRKRTGRPKIKS